MSGRKQHHVWQLLQRGFAVREKKSFYINVYRKDGTNFSTNTQNFGAERDFYSEQEDSTADDVITEFESKHSDFVKLLQESAPDQTVNDDRIPLLISHLEVRTKALRESFLDIGKELMEYFETEFSQPKNLRRFMLAYLQNDKARATQKIAEMGFNEHLANYAYERMIEELKHGSIKNVEKMFGELQGVTKKAKEDFLQRGRETHARVFENNAAPEQRAGHYKDMVFQTKSVFEGELILPDCMVISTSGNDVFPINSKGKTPDEVIIPLRSDKYLYGSSVVEIPRSAKQLNSMLASCAVEAFGVKRTSRSAERLVKRIGKNVELLTRHEISTTIREAMKGI